MFLIKTIRHLLELVFCCFSLPIERRQAHNEGAINFQWSRCHELLLATCGRPGHQLKVFNIRHQQVSFPHLEHWFIFKLRTLLMNEYCNSNVIRHGTIFHFKWIFCCFILLIQTWNTLLILNEFLFLFSFMWMPAWKHPMGYLGTSISHL